MSRQASPLLHRLDLKAFVFQHAAQRLPDAGFVVDDQDA